VKHNQARFYLASSSPRRRQLLENVGLCFDVISIEFDESSFDGEAPADFAGRMARNKATCAVGHMEQEGLPDLPVLAADTCVTIDGRILGKPRDTRHAQSMLRALSGCTHQVLTAIALADGDTVWQDLSLSQVTFNEISPRELDAYCASGEPNDKAGAYAIQGLGAAFVKRMEGSYTGVVGLPMYETRRLLNKFDIDWL